VEVPEAMLRMLLCLLEVPEGLRRVLLCMLEAVEGELCLLDVLVVLEVLEVPEVMRCVRTSSEQLLGTWFTFTISAACIKQVQLHKSILVSEVFLKSRCSPRSSSPSSP